MSEIKPRDVNFYLLLVYDTKNRNFILVDKFDTYIQIYSAWYLLNSLDQMLLEKQQYAPENSEYYYHLPFNYSIIIQHLNANTYNVIYLSNIIFHLEDFDEMKNKMTNAIENNTYFGLVEYISNILPIIEQPQNIKKLMDLKSAQCMYCMHENPVIIYCLSQMYTHFSMYLLNQHPSFNQLYDSYKEYISSR